MGIPAAFRWLSKKYPKILSPVIEDQPITLEDGTVILVDTTARNPNGEEFDNLYLDMNGIVHPCSHPEDKPAPKDEEEMMLEIFKYTDRVVNMVRPRQIFMIAVDGVAPRAKMNQQRSRRFRSAQEAKEKESEKQEFIELLQRKNGVLPPASSEELAKKAFDSNSITPGTHFMDILATSLRYWCQYKLNTDVAWSRLKVIISDSTVPGEGEHKIMSFIRSQRTSPNYNPNTRHVMYGLDADLIMLGLATHEPHFRVLREDVFAQANTPRTCKLCGQRGHEARNCRAEKKLKNEESTEAIHDQVLKPFIWLQVSVLREYLAAELAVPGLPFRFDLERAIDDWIFMCCFVGNDFLPHLPALEIREHGIDTLTAIWRNNIPTMGGYVTKDGHIDWLKAQKILDGLAKQEDQIFKRRKENEESRDVSSKRKRLLNDGHNASGTRQNGPKLRNSGYQDPSRGLQLHPIASYPKNQPQAMTQDVTINRASVAGANLANKNAASALRSKIQGEKVASHDTCTTGAPSVLGKRKGPDSMSNTMNAEGEAATIQAPNPGEGCLIDTVRFWEDEYADRYYEQKFGKHPEDQEFRRQVAHAYAEGLAWVLLYYFQGCPSWDWFYPYHYAPLAADFKGLVGLNINFEKGYISRPFEQLMSVLPAASRHALPEVFHSLMTDKDSEIIDFYPETFEIDLNGKKMAWQGVALLPFIDMRRLLEAVQQKYLLLSPEDIVRNSFGRDVLILADSHEGLYNEILTKFYSKRQGSSKFKLDPRVSNGLWGKVEKRDNYVPHEMLQYPLKTQAMPNLDYDRSISVYYDAMRSPQTHKSMLLSGVQMPKTILTNSEIEEVREKARRAGGSHGGSRFERSDAHNSHNGSMNRGTDLDWTRRRGRFSRSDMRWNMRPPGTT